MATYKLRLDKVEPRTDGLVRHDIFVLTTDDVPTGLHKDVLIPHYVVSSVLAVAANLRAAAYKNAIWEYRNNQTPVADTSEWSFDLLAASVGAMDAAQDMLEWLDSVGFTLPGTFDLVSP